MEVDASHRYVHLGRAGNFLGQRDVIPGVMTRVARTRWRSLLTLIALMLSACSSGQQSEAAATSPTGGTQVEASVAGADGFSVDVGEAQDSPGATFQHTLRIVNESESTLYIDDHRQGEFLGDKELLVGDDGCGWATTNGELKPACRADYRPLTLVPGETWSGKVAVWRDLPGLNATQQRSYSLAKTLRYRFDAPFEEPGQKPASDAVVTVTYSL